MWMDEDIKRQIYEDPLVTSDILKDPEYRPTRVWDDNPINDSPVGLRVHATVLPNLVPWRFGSPLEIAEHEVHEFTETEALEIDVMHVPITIDHTMYPDGENKGEIKAIGRVVESWMDENNLNVVFEVRETDSFLMHVAYAYLRDNLTLSVSLRHVYLTFRNAGVSMKFAVELSICTTPRREGANIYKIEVIGKHAKEFWALGEKEPGVETVWAPAEGTEEREGEMFVFLF